MSISFKHVIKDKASCKIFYTIGEVSKNLNIEQHVLRFWEEQFPAVKPIKRRGRRLYNHDNINVIMQIKQLLYEKGYTIKGAQKEINNNIDKAAENISITYKKCLANILVEIVSLRDYILKHLNGA